MPWILVQWRDRSSGTIGETAGKKISGKKTSGKAISGDNSKTALFLTISTVSRTIPIPFATHATRRAIFHPSAQREKENGGNGKGEGKGGKGFSGKGYGQFQPKGG